MASTGAGGVGPGWQVAYALAIALLWLCLQMQQAQPAAGTTEAVCGKPTVTGKIFGGQDAPEKKWPWQVSLFYHGSHICGGSLIDTFWVISAAHCFQPIMYLREPLSVVLTGQSETGGQWPLSGEVGADRRVGCSSGYHKLSQPTKHSLQRSVYRIIIHNDFNKQYFLARDVALLQLHLSVTFNSYILPACLPGPDAVLPLYTVCWLTGWGMVTEDEFLKPPLQLQEAELGVMSSDSCNLYFQSPDSMDSKYSVHEDMLCAGNLLSGKSLCRGDSGGPLSCKLNGSWFLMGLSSWSLLCHQPIRPNVFTRVTYFANWIKEKQRASPNPDPSSAPPQKTSSVLNNSGDNRPRSSRALLFSQTFPLLLVSFRDL
ncbi:inactive serine protease 39-like [Rhynchonycteris naso]